MSKRSVLLRSDSGNSYYLGDKVWRLRQVFVVITMSAPLVSCGSIRSTAKGVAAEAMAGVREEQSEIFDIERTLADSAVAFMAQGMEERVFTRVTTTWDSMVGNLQEESEGVIATIEEGTQGNINRSIQLLLDDNFDLLENRGSQLVERVIGVAVRRATFGVDSVAVEAVASMARHVRTDLRPTILGIVSAASDSVIKTAITLDSIAAQSRTLSKISRGLYTAAGIVGAALAVLVGAFIYKFRKRGKALRVLIDVIDEAGGQPLEDVKKSIKTRARAARVQPFITSQVNDRRRLRAAGRDP